MIGKEWNIELKQTVDILSNIDKMDIKTIAFKAEMDAEHGLEHAKQLLTNKAVDAVCYNLLQDSSSFGADKNEISFITTNNITSLGKADKLTLSDAILLEAQRLAND